MTFNPFETGKRIKKLREAKKMNQYDLAEELHVSHSHMSKIETGHRIGSIDIYMNLAEFFGVSLDYLLVGNRNEVTRTKLRIAIDILEGIDKSL